MLVTGILVKSETKILELARLAVTLKGAWFKSNWYLSLVLFVGLFGFVSYTVLCMLLGWSGAA